MKLKYKFLLLFLYAITNQTEAQTNLLNALESTIIFKGDNTTVYRDPVILFRENEFHML